MYVYKCQLVCNVCVSIMDLTPIKAEYRLIKHAYAVLVIVELGSDGDHKSCVVPKRSLKLLKYPIQKGLFLRLRDSVLPTHVNYCARTHTIHNVFMHVTEHARLS